MSDKKTKIYIFIICILGLLIFIGFGVICTPELKYQYPFLKDILEGPLFVVIMICTLLIFPTTIVGMVDYMIQLDRLKNHKIYLKAMFPQMDFDHLSRKDINKCVGALDYLLDNKTGFLSNPRVGAVGMVTKMAVTTQNSKNERQIYYENHIEELKRLHPEIDFNNLRAIDRLVIDDELDAMIYAKKIP